MDMTTNAIVVTTPTFAAIIFVLNIILPGMGTLLASVVASKRGLLYKSRCN